VGSHGKLWCFFMGQCLSKKKKHKTLLSKVKLNPQEAKESLIERRALSRKKLKQQMDNKLHPENELSNDFDLNEKNVELENSVKENGLRQTLDLDSESEDDVVMEQEDKEMLSSVKKLNISGEDRDNDISSESSDDSLDGLEHITPEPMILSSKQSLEASNNVSMTSSLNSSAGVPITQSQEARKHPAIMNQPTYSPKILKTAIPPHLAKDFHRTKSNSTSSLFINSTLNAPDNEEIVRCMSVALYWAIKKSEKVKNKKFIDVFSEKTRPLDDDIDLENSPSQEKIFEFLMKIFNAESLSAECGVMCMAYIERLLTLTGVTMHASNWRKIVLGALILASKVWEDQAVWNVDFLNVFPNVTVDDLNKLERHYLDALQFNVSLKGSVYAKYYFELRSLSERDAKHFPLKPLDKEGQLRLEVSNPKKIPKSWIDY